MLNFFAQIILASQDISRGVSHPEKVHMVFTGLLPVVLKHELPYLRRRMPFKTSQPL